MPRVLVLLAGFAVLLALAQDEAQGCSATGTLPCLELNRDDQIVTVQQTALDSEGGLFSSRTFDEAAPCSEAGRTLTVFYAPAPKLIETRIDDTLITSNAVLRDQPEGVQDEATLDIFGGTLELNPDTRCPENVARSDDADVTLTEGRSTVQGAHLLYDNASGDGEMSGSETSQVTLERAAEGDSPALNASADTLSFNSDEDERTFTGNVVITSEDRVSEADTLVYNDAAGVAVLQGNPASSREGDEFVQGSIITYYLDSNDVVVSGGVAGEFTLELEGDGSTTSDDTPLPDEEPDEEPPGEEPPAPPLEETDP